MRQKRISLKRKQSFAGYVFLLPVIIGIIWLFLPSLFLAFRYSLSDITMGLDGIELTDIGFRNYYHILFVNNSSKYLFNSFKQAAIQIPVITIFSFFIANVLNQKFFGRGLSRTLFFLPVIISAGILGMLEAGDAITSTYFSGAKLNIGAAGSAIYNYESLRQTLQASQLNKTLVQVILSSIDNLYGIITASGVQILIFLAGLQSIPDSLFEAAQMEGSNGWVNFWKISFPMISPLIIVNAVYTTVDSFTSYQNEAMQYIRIFLYGNNKYSYATALSLIYILIVGIVLAIGYRILSRFIIYKDA